MAQTDPAPFLGQRVKVSHKRTSSTGVLIYEAVTGPTGKAPDAIVVREDDGTARVIANADITGIASAFDENKPGAGPTG